MGGLGAYVGTVGPMMRTLWFGRGFVWMDHDSTSITLPNYGEPTRQRRAAG